MNGVASQDELYRDVAEQFGSALERLARAYEVDPDKRRDLIQEIHFQLWRSFERFDARCSTRTWVYRVAHHVAASHVLRERRKFSNLVSVEELEMLPDKDHGHFAADRRINLDRLSAFDSTAQATRPPGDRLLSRRHGRGVDRRNHGAIAGQCGHANIADQEYSGAAVS